MKTGKQQDVVLNYRTLYKSNPKTARTALMEIVRQTNNISLTARMFGTSRKVVQLAIKKDRQGNLADYSHKKYSKTSKD
jgi:hypothetical protein